VKNKQYIGQEYQGGIMHSMCIGRKKRPNITAIQGSIVHMSLVNVKDTTMYITLVKKGKTRYIPHLDIGSMLN
jgi:hypothetical protein